jgi:hypothetical protein
MGSVSYVTLRDKKRKHLHTIMLPYFGGGIKYHISTVDNILANIV